MDDRTMQMELDRRLAELEKPENQGGGLSSGDWIFLLLTGVIGPVLLLLWGW
ncbi:hypothetical protein [Actibacterium sp. MT2.3-13A]|uniref:hypothetical protein n=1 Tax=Actibacterium sp. MT2.3-13A TaxID=2828332 RepID=UPI001BAD4772|nr:hypothetical protein [Actibacterium sp. MT2.3-13A]